MSPTLQQQLDDLGVLKHGANESEGLFPLIAERYERRSLIVTSNMVFSQWTEEETQVRQE